MRQILTHKLKTKSAKNRKLRKGALLPPFTLTQSTYGQKKQENKKTVGFFCRIYSEARGRATYLPLSPAPNLTTDQDYRQQPERNNHQTWDRRAL